MRVSRPLLAGLSIAAGLLVAIGVLEATLRFLPVFSGLDPDVVDAGQPIARFVPAQSYTYSRGWNFRGVNRGRINGAGFVNDQEYAEQADQPLVAVIGDSYVEALMVPYSSSFHGKLAVSLRGKARVYSFGVSGAPLSQYLAMASWVGAKYHPAAMVIVVIGNDFDESLIRYKSTPGFHYFDDSQVGTPVVRIDYSPNPLRLRRSALYRYLRHNLAVVDVIRDLVDPPETVQYVGNVAATMDAERVARSEAIIDVFLDRLAPTAGLSPGKVLFVLDGMRPSLYTDEGLRMAEGSYWSRMRDRFITSASARGYVVIDMQPDFVEHNRATGARFEFADDGHWNETAHDMVAEAVRDRTPVVTLPGS